MYICNQQRVSCKGNDLRKKHGTKLHYETKGVTTPLSLQKKTWKCQKFLLLLSNKPYKWFWTTYRQTRYISENICIWSFLFWRCFVGFKSQMVLYKSVGISVLFLDKLEQIHCLENYTYLSDVSSCGKGTCILVTVHSKERFIIFY